MEASLNHRLLDDSELVGGKGGENDVVLLLLALMFVVEIECCAIKENWDKSMNYCCCGGLNASENS